MVRYKSYKYFHWKTSTGQKDASQSLVTILHDSDWTMLK